MLTEKMYQLLKSVLIPISAEVMNEQELYILFP
jgi:hypothetical protein